MRAMRGSWMEGVEALCLHLLSQKAQGPGVKCIRGTVQFEQQRLWRDGQHSAPGYSCKPMAWRT